MKCDMMSQFCTYKLYSLVIETGEFEQIGNYTYPFNLLWPGPMSDLELIL